MKRKASIAILLGLVAFFFLPPLPFQSSDQARADRRGRERFSKRSLNGSYASSGSADGFQSRSIGVTTFDGRGNVERFVSINASDGEGGRRNILLTSTGTYTVDASGIGEIRFLNEFVDGGTSEVTFDFVIAKSSDDGERGSLIAEEITGLQREAGVTASLIEEYWTLREGL